MEAGGSGYHFVQQHFSKLNEFRTSLADEMDEKYWVTSVSGFLDFSFVFAENPNRRQYLSVMN